VDGKLEEGCHPCMAKIQPACTLSTEKRLHEGEGYSYMASAAQLDHIRHRRISPDDGRSVIQDRR